MAISKLFRSGVSAVARAAEQSTPAGPTSGSSRTITSRLSRFVGLRLKPPHTSGETSTAAAPPRRTLAELMHREEPTTLTAGFLNVPLRDETPQTRPSLLKIGSQNERQKVQFSSHVRFHGSDHQAEVKQHRRTAKEYVRANSFRLQETSAETSSRKDRIQRAAELLENLVHEKPGNYDQMIAEGFLPRAVLAQIEGLTWTDREDVIIKFQELPVKRREAALIDAAARRFLEMVNSAAPGTFDVYIEQGMLPEALHSEFDDELLSRDKDILRACNRLDAEARRFKLQANLAALSDD